MKIKRILLLVLSTLIIFTASVIPSVSAYASVDYDYSRAGSYFNTEFTSADVLELIGYSLSDVERAYLNEYGALSVKYETVTTQQIGVITVDGVIRVSAHTYSYVGANGASVTWTPTSVSIDGVSSHFVLDNGVYTAEFLGLVTSDNSMVRVKYDMNTVSIRAEDVNSVLNVAYTDAVALKTEITSYIAHLDEINEYFTLLDSYRKYLGDKLVYEEKRSAYDKYVSDCLIYTDELTRYEAYLLELEEYNRIKDNNDSYEANRVKYESDLVKYNQYLSDLTVANQQTKMLHDGLMNTVTYLNRQLYGCIFADLVDEVVGRKDELTKIGASKEDIEKCAVATANIRSVLKPEGGVAYTDLKTDEEKYAFYVNNYEIIRDSIIVLAQSLHGVYSTDGVRITMHAASNLLDREDYTERLAIFIAQLICLANAMSVEPIMSSDGKIVLDSNVTFDYRDSYGVDRRDVKLTDLLEGETFVEDIANPLPLNLVEVSEPKAPEILELPTAPNEVAKPTEPTYVQDPGDEPTPVAEPVKPVFAPDNRERLEIINNETYLHLISALDLGLLKGDRQELTDDVLFTPTVTLTKSLAPSDIVEVTFLDTDGDLITTIGAEKGTAVNFTEALPEKNADISATYVFDSWLTSDGLSYDLSSVTEDVTLYPSFRPIYKEYDVIDKGSIDYLDVNVIGENLSEVPLSHFIELSMTSHHGILFTADNVSMSVPYSAVVELAAFGAERLSVFVNTASLDAFTFSIYAYNEDGKLCQHVNGISVSIPCADETFAKDSVLSYLDGDGQRREVSKSYSSGLLTFVASTRTNYSFELKYSISANSNLSGMITAPENATPGQPVRLVMDIPCGTKVETLYYTLLSDNSRHNIDGDSFVMPYGNIRIGATLTELEFTVKFVVDGKVISEKGGYKYGETVKVPNNPTKVNDEQYSYTFIGWSPEISTVRDDVTYVAKFEATPLPKVENKVSLFNILFYSGLAVFILAILSVLTFVLNKFGVINVRGALNFVKKKFTRVRDNSLEESSSDDSKEE